MSAKEIDDYLRGVEEPKRSTLQALRETIIELLPEAEQCISYDMPGFRVENKMIAGFAAFKNHLSYFPHSGSVLPELQEELAKYKSKGIAAAGKGTLRFPIHTALPKPLVKKLISVRLRQAFD